LRASTQSPSAQPLAVSRSAVALPLLSLLIATVFLTGATLAAEKYTVTRDVPYVDRGDRTLTADVYVPDGKGPYPGILMVHGGAWVSGDKAHVAGYARTAAAAGYTVVAIRYRFAPKDPFPAQIEDCQEAVRWMRRNAQKYKVDPERIAGFGYSAGAHLVCLLGMTDNLDWAAEFAHDIGKDRRGAETKEGTAGDGGSPAGEGGKASGEDEAKEKKKDEIVSDHLQAVVAGGTPCDFTHLPLNNQSMVFLLGGTRRDRASVYRLASPVKHITRDDPPVFFFHGEDDALVPRRGVESMARQLADAGVKVETWIVPGKGHITTFLDPAAPDKMVDFLDRVLKDSPDGDR